MIEITEEYEYQREACDCCDGWWDKLYRVVVNGEDRGRFVELEDALLTASSYTMNFTYTQVEPPPDSIDYDDFDDPEESFD